jgi:hypothetical protein
MGTTVASAVRLSQSGVKSGEDHGEPEATSALAHELQEDLGLDVHVADYLDKYRSEEVRI